MRATLGTHDRGRVNVMPQTDAKIFWRMKRFLVHLRLASRLAHAD